jgi:competence protein ComEA
MVFRISAFLFLGSIAGYSQLPEGPGRAETQKICSGCHEFERSISLRQDRDSWKATISKMVGFGANGAVEEMAAVLEYLSTNYPAPPAGLLNVNTARAIEFESRLSLRRSEAAAVIDYRTKNGPFKSIDDLKKISGIDPAKFETKKEILSFK